MWTLCGIFSKLFIFIMFFKGKWSTESNTKETVPVLWQNLARKKYRKNLEKNIEKCKFFEGILGGQTTLFPKLSIKISSGLLRWGQCIKTILLCYQNGLSGNLFSSIFHFKGGPFWLREGNTLHSLEKIAIERKPKKIFLNHTDMETSLGTWPSLKVDRFLFRIPLAQNVPIINNCCKVAYRKIYDWMNVHCPLFPMQVVYKSTIKWQPS